MFELSKVMEYPQQWTSSIPKKSDAAAISSASPASFRIIYRPAYSFFACLRDTKLKITGRKIALANASDEKHFGQPVSVFGHVFCPSISRKDPVAASKNTGIQPKKNKPRRQNRLSKTEINIEL